ncbi:MAG: M20/M25/M40 family metallo-hydrolase [Chitinophagaceae bacterium]|nr:M20/M25/M40 family metallo-hydrolase [Chitinophagaceae bacterium]
MKRLTLLSALLTCALAGQAQQNDSAVFSRISSHILTKGKCYEDLRILCKKIGNRISGSKQAEWAVEWGEKTLREAGCDKVWLQPVEVPVWKRGEEHLALKFSNDQDYIDVPMSSLGNSEGTGDKVLKAPILMLGSFEELENLSAQDVEGKIIFFNYRFRQDFPNTFPGYGDAVKYRWQSPIIAGKKKPAAIIIRSISTGEDDFPHTGSTRYEENGPKFPVVAIGNKTADRLERACTKGHTYAALRSNCGMKGTAMSYNVIGEISGSTKPNDYIVVGGHLDSWDVGEGAHDDGAGCVQSIEVLRSFKQLGIRPKHTIRAVLFMNEENGLKGGVAYADSAKARKEHHIFALESDAGGFAPRGIETTMDKKQRDKFKKYIPLFLPYGVYNFNEDGGGADVSPLKKQGVVIGELLPDSQRYFDLHHTDADVFEAVNHRELKLGAAAMAMMIYIVDQKNIVE